MNNSNNISIYELKKVVRDIKSWDGDWRYAETFDILVRRLNTVSVKLGLPYFAFEEFHYSSTGKTINDTGYSSLINHIELLEEILNSLEVNKANKDVNFKSSTNSKDSKKVFIVHGRDRAALLETESILNRAGLEPIVLSRMTNQGLTLIEKFEKYADVAYAIVLLTPDDIGALYENAPIDSLNHQFRARQNVLFELGFFYGKLGRTNVSCILKSNVEKPTDIDGIVYLPYRESVEEIEYPLLRELNDVGLNCKVF